MLNNLHINKQQWNALFQKILLNVGLSSRCLVNQKTDIFWSQASLFGVMGNPMYLRFCGQIPIIYKMFQSGIEIDVAFLRLRQTDSMTVKLVNGGRRPLGGLQVVGRTWRRILEVVFLQVFSYQQYYITFFIQKAKVCISNIIFE